MGKSPKKKGVQAAVRKSNKDQQGNGGGRGNPEADTVSPLIPKTVIGPGTGQHDGGKKDHPKV